jgi:hypothetical protein
VAIASAAIFTPAAIAEAKPDLLPITPVTDMFSIDLFGTDPILGPVQIPTDSPWWWVGNGPNPNAPTTNAANAAAANVAAAIAPSAAPRAPFFVFEFAPLSLIPGFLQPLVGWFLNFIPQFTICLGIGGVSVGPYGKLTVKLGSC